MKNKIIAFLCVVAMAVCALASCGGECAHELSEEWANDANGHWHPTICEHGEFRGESEAHVDADEDGLCDICAYDAKHVHTFASEWSIDEDKHWKVATCSHTDVKGEESLHVDEDLNGVCDVCSGHVHTLDGAGFCTTCNKEVKPVVESDIGSVISATTARTHNVVSSTIDRYAESRNPNNPADDLIFAHVAEVLRGTNGTYVKWTYDEVEESVDENGNDVAIKTDKTEILEKWIKIVSPDVVTGISATSVDGVYKNAEPNAYSVDDLAGYYYSVSSLADGHGAEAVLLALYEVYLECGTEEAEIVWDDENNKYDFNFKALVVDKTTTEGVDLHEYAAYYFEVKVSFTYADDYTLTSFDVECDAYTSDDGLKYSDGTLAPPDFDYNYETGEFTMREVTNPAKYTYSVTQTVGTRTEIELNDGSEFMPEGFELYLDTEFTTPVGDSFTVDIMDVNQEFYIKATPETAFPAFIAFNFGISVTDANGNPTSGLQVVVYSYDVIQIFPSKGGEYTVTFSACGQQKSMTIIVDAPEIMGEQFITLEVLDSYSWSDGWTEDGVVYEFKPETYGEYTFYLPANFGMAEVKQWDNGGVPNADYYGEANRTVTVTIRPGQVFRFYFAAAVKGTYQIGYDAP